MARYDYSGILSTANTLIDRFGQDAILRSYTEDGDEADPTRLETDFAVVVVVTDYSEREKAGTQIQSTDRRALLRTLDLTVAPAIDDDLYVNGVRHKIVNVTTVDPGGTVLLYDLRVRI